MFIYIYIRTYIHTYIHIYVYIYICIYIYIYMYLYIYICLDLICVFCFYILLLLLSGQIAAGNTNSEHYNMIICTSAVSDQGAHFHRRPWTMWGTLSSHRHAGTLLIRILAEVTRNMVCVFYMKHDMTKS